MLLSLLFLQNNTAAKIKPTLSGILTLISSTTTKTRRSITAATVPAAKLNSVYNYTLLLLLHHHHHHHLHQHDSSSSFSSYISLYTRIQITAKQLPYLWRKKSCQSSGLCGTERLVSVTEIALCFSCREPLRHRHPCCLQYGRLQLAVDQVPRSEAVEPWLPSAWTAE